MRVILTIVVFVLFGLNQINAQAFDGEDDYKVFIGYMNLDGNSGLEVSYDYGLNDVLSTGGYIKYLLVDKVGDDNAHVSLDGLDKVNFGAFLRAHFSEPLNLSTKIDPYIGGELSFKSLGAHAGVKYNFGEVVGVYAQVSHSFSAFIQGEDSDFINLYAKKTALSGGITLYF